MNLKPTKFSITVIDGEISKGPTEITAKNIQEALVLVLNKYHNQGIEFSTEATCKIAGPPDQPAEKPGS